MTLLLLACVIDLGKAGPDSATESRTVESSRPDSPADTDTGCGTAVVVWDDVDRDGYGDPTTERTSCEVEGGQVTQGGDCDDTVASTHPGATETWSDGVDSDCSGYDECGPGAVYVGRFRPYHAAEVESFCDTWSQVDGSFSIVGDTGSSDWTGELLDLSSVSCLCAVSGSLGVWGTDELGDLRGLEGVEEVGWVVIGGNARLTSVEGLEGLRHVTGPLEIGFWERWGSLHGLGSLERVDDYMSIGVVASLDGLDSLVEVGSDLALHSSQDLGSLPALTTVGGLRITSTGVSTFAGLSRLATIRGLFELAGVGGITDFASFPALAEIGGDIRLNQTDLTSLCGLGPVEFAGFVELDEAPYLTSIAALAGRPELGGFEATETALPDLTGLEDLTVLHGSLELVRNEQLTDISALGSLTRVEGDFVITDNPLLPQADAEALYARIGEANVTGTVTIDGNGP